MLSKGEIETLKNLVENILKKDERARNDDLWLYLQVLISQGHKIYINFDELESMPKPESVSRIRRQIQNNENKFTPDEYTQRKRQRNYEESKELWRNSHLSW